MRMSGECLSHLQSWYGQSIVIIQTVHNNPERCRCGRRRKKVEALVCSTGKAAEAPSTVAIRHSFAGGLKRCLATRFWNPQIPAYPGYGTHTKTMSVTAKIIILKVFMSETRFCSTFLGNWHNRISSMTVDFTIPMVWWDRYFFVVLVASHYWVGQWLSVCYCFETLRKIRICSAVVRIVDTKHFRNAFLVF